MAEHDGLIERIEKHLAIWFQPQDIGTTNGDGLLREAAAALRAQDERVAKRERDLARITAVNADLSNIVNRLDAERAAALSRITALEAGQLTITRAYQERIAALEALVNGYRYAIVDRYYYADDCVCGFNGNGIDVPKSCDCGLLDVLDTADSTARRSLLAGKGE